MKKKLAGIVLLLLGASVPGCAALVEKTRQEAEERQRYVMDIWSKAEATSIDLMRQAERKAVIPKSLTVVYRAATQLVSDQSGRHPMNKPSEDPLQRKITFEDGEPILHNKKPVRPAGKSSFLGDFHDESLNILVTVLMEAQGPDTTVVYYYPHHRLCSKIPPEAQKAVEATMNYRGGLLLYRLETQSMSRERWAWLAR